jgi:hypothetical protein
LKFSEGVFKRERKDLHLPVPDGKLSIFVTAINVLVEGSPEGNGDP